MSPGSLSDRIRGIVRPAPHVAPELSLQAPVSPAPHGPFDPIEQVLGGAWQTHGTSLPPPGRCFIVERTEPADSWHGSVQVGDLAARLAGAAGDAPLLAAGAPARLPFVFFDLETTGLSGGAGTLAFLIGCGWFDADGAFLTRQYMLARAGDERPMLQLLAERFATAGALVSFNGKSFDAPLLESRYLFHRLEWPGARLPHVDILHPARRFWRAASATGEMSSCSLSVLERQILGAGAAGRCAGTRGTGAILSVRAVRRCARAVRRARPQPDRSVVVGRAHGTAARSALWRCGASEQCSRGARARSSLRTGGFRRESTAGVAACADPGGHCPPSLTIRPAKREERGRFELRRSRPSV